MRGKAKLIILTKSAVREHLLECRQCGNELIRDSEIVAKRQGQNYTAHYCKNCAERLCII